MKKKYFTVHEATRKLKISKQPIFEAIKTGRLKATRRPITKTILHIPTESLESFEVSLSHKSRGLKKG